MIQVVHNVSRTFQKRLVHKLAYALCHSFVLEFFYPSTIKWTFGGLLFNQCFYSRVLRIKFSKFQAKRLWKPKNLIRILESFLAPKSVFKEQRRILHSRNYKYFALNYSILVILKHVCLTRVCFLFVFKRRSEINACWFIQICRCHIISWPSSIAFDSLHAVLTNESTDESRLKILLPRSYHIQLTLFDFS